MIKRKYFDIDQYINIEEVKEEEKVICRLINLRLNNESLAQILEAKLDKYKLRISPELKFQLYRCMICDGETINNNISRFQSGVTFCTYYEFAGAEKIVIQSVISPQGDIMQKIRRDYLDFPERILKIAAVHHWVLEKLMRLMGLKINVQLNWLPVILASVLAIIIVTVGMVFYHTEITIINVVGLVIMWVLFYLGFAQLLKVYLSQLKKWIGYQVLLQLLLPNSQYKSIEKSFLGKFID